MSAEKLHNQAMTCYDRATRTDKPNAPKHLYQALVKEVQAVGLCDAEPTKSRLLESSINIAKSLQSALTDSKVVDGEMQTKLPSQSETA